MVLLDLALQGDNNAYRACMEACGAGNNGWSMDNVCPDWGVDRSNVRLASHVDRSHSIILK